MLIAESSLAILGALAPVVNSGNFRCDKNFTHGSAGRQPFEPFIVAAGIDLKKTAHIPNGKNSGTL